MSDHGNRGWVVIADDVAGVAMIVGALIENAGFLVRYARNGAEVLEAVSDCNPVAVVCDARMPTMSGMAAAAELAKTHPNLPVIITTTNATDALKRTGNITAVVEKEDLVSVVAILEKVLGLNAV